MTLAFIGAFGRIYVWAHHFSDVIVGASMGYGFSLIVLWGFK